MIGHVFPQLSKEKIAMIDITFLSTSDTPEGKDPDAHSPTLKKYHKQLWSKPLPNGKSFELSDDTKGVYLHHHSELGEFRLSSDAISGTYEGMERMAHIIREVPQDEVSEYLSLARTIGAYIIFPSNKIENKITINGLRGFSRKITDRFDLTLECIKRHYENIPSPLGETLERYADFFALFDDFGGYVDFFLLQDQVSNGTVKYYLPFSSFDDPPLPRDVVEYQFYKNNVIDFIRGRNRRIASLN
jgi:hypothetical protein